MTQNTEYFKGLPAKDHLFYRIRLLHHQAYKGDSFAGWQWLRKKDKQNRHRAWSCGPYSLHCLLCFWSVRQGMYKCSRGPEPCCEDCSKSLFPEVTISTFCGKTDSRVPLSLNAARLLVGCAKASGNKQLLLECAKRTQDCSPVSRRPFVHIMSY